MQKLPPPEDFTATPLEEYTTYPLVIPPIDEVVESNYDPNIHTKLFWLESYSQNHIAESFCVDGEPTIENAETHISEQSSAGSPTESKRRLQLDNAPDADIAKESEVSNSPSSQYFRFDVIPHQYNDDPYFEFDASQFPTWNHCVEGKSSQF